MKESRDAIDVDIPAAPVHDLFHLFAERPTHNESSSPLPLLSSRLRKSFPLPRQGEGQGGGTRSLHSHETSSRCGNPSTETNASLKSVRPDSSTYSMRAGSSNATCRSRYDSRAIFAPSPAELPTAMILSTSTGGTR